MKVDCDYDGRLNLSEMEEWSWITAGRCTAQIWTEDNYLVINRLEKGSVVLRINLATGDIIRGGERVCNEQYELSKE